MKVRDLIGSSSAIRGVFAVSLAWAMAVGGAAPLVANAEAVALSAAPAPAPAPAPSTETTLVPPVTAVDTTPAVVATPPAAPAKRISVRGIVVRTGMKAGLSKAELKALLWICKRESNFHPKSHSRSGYHGLFQLSAGMAHGRNWKDPAWNTKRAIRYMRGRYGGVLQAKAFWMANHWY